ncbi:phospholipase D family protein [Litorisediminicola beolgyonensis]|uniref:Phospholipase D n=1 Tax=Litorisediminicola beolgyonensis TaxID=1173614 RepID=A0ABW3ZI83_9RHOB
MTLTPLITAAEVFPELERLVASAEKEVFLSFRIFDPETKLRDPELRERGLDTWLDLLSWVARRGVTIRLLITDFDPLFASSLHRLSWRSASQVADRVEGDVHVICAPHGQRLGWLWMVPLWMKVREKLNKLRSDDPQRLTPPQRRTLETRPVLRPVSIHQKCAVIDNARCLIGGLDLNERRWDDPDHTGDAEETWHDVSARVDGPFAETLRPHLVDTWNAAVESGASALAGQAQKLDAGPRSQGTSDLRLLRTMSAPSTGPAAFGPKPRYTENEDVMIRLIGEAEDHIYIESQFLRHRPIVTALTEAAERAEDLQLILILPPEPERILFGKDDGWDARHAHALQVQAIDALQDAYGSRVAVISPGQKERADPDFDGDLHGAGPIYVHAKVMLIDDRVGVIGSANLNGRSLRWDTEASVLFRDADTVRALRERLATTWLGPFGADRDVTRAETWRDAAAANKDAPPEERESFVIAYPLERARAFSRYLPILPANMF